MSSILFTYTTGKRSRPGPAAVLAAPWPAGYCSAVLSKLAKTSSDVVARTVLGETLLVPVRGDVAQLDHIFILNQTGGFLWSQLDGKKNVNDLARMLSEEFSGVSIESACRDVETFLSEVDRRDLIGWYECHE